MLGFWLLIVLLLDGCGAGGADDPAPVVQAIPPAPAQQEPDPEPAPSTTRRWLMTGTFADGRTMQWTFTYEYDATPTAVNVRDDPNAIYTIRDVELQVHEGGLFGMPAVNLSTAPVEFCIGECIFSPVLYLRLFASTPLHQLQILFIPPVPAQGPPRTVLDWGTLETNGSWLTSYTEMGELVLRVVLRSLVIEVAPMPAKLTP